MAMQKPGQLWSMTHRKFIDPPPTVRAFLDAYRAICHAHGLAFSHEDSHGGFIVAPVTDYLLDWATSPSLDLEVK